MNEIKIYKSVWKGIKLILLCSIFVVPSIFFLIKGQGDDNFKFWLAIGFFGFGYPLGLFMIFDRRPQIVLNETGIFDRNLSDKIINWEIIKEAYLVQMNKQSFICLKVDEEYLLSRSKGRVYRSFAKLNKELGFQELNISLGAVNVSAEKLLNLIQQSVHADHSTRKMLLESGIV